MQPKIGLTPATPIKVMLNIGALMDIPTGFFVKGRYGESILNGGLGFMTGMVGHGNNFKSTILEYMQGKAMARMKDSTGSIYDTEANKQEDRVSHLLSFQEEFEGLDPIDAGHLVVTDKTKYSGDQYFDILKDFMNDKIKNNKNYEVTLPFVNRERNGNIKIPIPTFAMVDSISDFTTSDVIKMQDDNSLGDSKGNTIFMRQGIQKHRFLMEVPPLSAGSYNYILMTAQIGQKIQMDQYAPPPKVLQHLKGDVAIKGVPPKFTYLTNNCWHAYNASLLVNKTTKAAEFPLDKADNDAAGDTDLNTVFLRMLRSKSGQSGYVLEIVVSQRDGVQPTLTEFNYIRNNEYYGLVGSKQNYSVAFLPEVALSRTVVRRKIDEEPKLRRAINICSELLQIKTFLRAHDDVHLDPEALYTKLKELGYDWDVLLNTRGWYTYNNDEHSVPFLSTLDLLNMAAQKYVPYWMAEADVPASCKHIERSKVF